MGAPILRLDPRAPANIFFHCWHDSRNRSLHGSWFASAEVRRATDGPLGPKLRQKNTISGAGRNGVSYTDWMDHLAVLDRSHYVRRGVHLEWFTIVYNSLEGLIALAAGFLSGSIALVGFGFDSALEVTSGGALLWRLGADAHERTREKNEAAALRIVGICVVLLAVYVGYDAIQSLVSRVAPQPSLV